MQFGELEDGTIFKNAYFMPFEKVSIYASFSRLTGRAQHYNAVSLFDFEECYFNDDELVYKDE